MLVLFDEERNAAAGHFSCKPFGAVLCGGPAAAAALRKQRSAGGPYDRAPGLASLRPRIARSSALLRALRIVPLFDCGSRRASRPAKQRRSPMGFCISLPVLLRQREVMHRKE